MELGFSAETIVFEDHHLSHAAAAYYGCPWWRDEPLLVLTNDAGGDGLCATVSIGEQGKLRKICEIAVSESIGYIYSMITFLMGMVPEEHEYKVMGMAPYSSKNRHQQLCRRFEHLLEFDGASDGLGWQRRNGCPPTQYSHGFFKRFIETERFDWICGGLQDFAENFLARWAQNCIKATGIHKLALGGGVFMNVKANKRIMELPEVESVFIFPSCGDETNCIGAAYLTHARQRTSEGLPVDIEPVGPVYFGTDFDDESIEDALRQYHFKYSRPSSIEKEIAALLSSGEAVARFKGPMEFGARALGNRSILADPTRRDVVKTINEMIKNRDFWMPFAPSMLAERASDYLINPKNVESPYMIMSFDTTDKVDQVYAASHPYDQTVRPQLVRRHWNPDYHELLKEFEKLTGRGAILNTSFNLHGHPIVHSPKDALDVFTNSGLKYMGMGSFLVKK
jgi:carbamoyltransferase